jgi:hypothetical protein
MLVEVASSVIPEKDAVVASQVMLVEVVTSATSATSVPVAMAGTAVTTTTTITIATTRATEDQGTFFYFLGTL